MKETENELDVTSCHKKRTIRNQGENRTDARRNATDTKKQRQKLKVSLTLGTAPLMSELSRSVGKMKAKLTVLPMLLQSHKRERERKATLVRSHAKQSSLTLRISIAREREVKGNTCRTNKPATHLVHAGRLLYCTSLQGIPTPADK